MPRQIKEACLQKQMRLEDAHHSTCVPEEKMWSGSISTHVKHFKASWPTPATKMIVIIQATVEYLSAILLRLSLYCLPSIPFKKANSVWNRYP